MLNIFIVALTTHIISDFLLMPDFLFEGKHRTMQGVIVHLIIMTIITYSTIFYFFGGDSWPLAIIICSCHCIIDFIKPIFLRKVGGYDFLYFIVDQLLHILVLVMAAKIADTQTMPLEAATEEFVHLTTLALIGLSMAPFFARLTAYNVFPDFYKKRGITEVSELFCDALLGVTAVVVFQAISIYWMVAGIVLLMWVAHMLFSWGLARVTPMIAVFKGGIILPLTFAFSVFLAS